MDTDKNLTAILREMGLSEYESSAYNNLLKLRTSTAKAIASEAEIPQSRIYDVLERLESKGFVTIQPGRPKKYGPIDPEIAVKHYCDYKQQEYEQEIEETKETGEEFVEMFKNNVDAYRQAEREDVDIGWTHSDRLKILEQLAELTSEANSEILMITTPEGFKRIVNHHGESLRSKYEQGADIRVLVARGDSIPQPIRENADEWCELRFVDNIEGRIYMYDSKDILVAFQNNNKNGYVGLSTKSRTLYRTLSYFFELLWEKGEYKK